MKIAMYNLTTTCRYGGVETFVWEVSRELARRGQEVHIYGGKGDILHSIPKVEVRVFPFWRRERVPDLGRRFRKLAERWSMAARALPPLIRGRYDIIHIHKPFDLPVGWMARKWGKAKLVLGSHGTDFFAGDRIFGRRVDGAVSCSDYNRELIRRRYGMNPEVIFNGIDPEAFHPFPSPDRELMGKYSLAPGDRVILYVGRLIGLKGVPVLLRAFSLLKDRSRAKLLIVGDGRGGIHSRIRPESWGSPRRPFGPGSFPTLKPPATIPWPRLPYPPAWPTRPSGFPPAKPWPAGCRSSPPGWGGFPSWPCTGRPDGWPSRETTGTWRRRCKSFSMTQTSGEGWGIRGSGGSPNFSPGNGWGTV